MPAPIALAMIACDGFFKDPFTHKHTLIGTFSTIGAPRFPVVHPRIVVYVALTDGHGRSELLLEMLDADEERPPVFQFTGPVTFDDPRNVIEICFQTGELHFPAPGEYRLKLTIGGEPVAERRVLLTQHAEAGL